jgi:hypothetical protein
LAPLGSADFGTGCQLGLNLLHWRSSDVWSMFSLWQKQEMTETAPLLESLPTSYSIGLRKSHGQAPNEWTWVLFILPLLGDLARSHDSERKGLEQWCHLPHSSSSSSLVYSWHSALPGVGFPMRHPHTCA